MPYQTSRTLEIKWSVKDPESDVKYCEWAVGKNVTCGGVVFEASIIGQSRYSKLELVIFLPRASCSAMLFHCAQPSG